MKSQMKGLNFKELVFLVSFCNKLAIQIALSIAFCDILLFILNKYSLRGNFILQVCACFTISRFFSLFLCGGLCVCKSEVYSLWYKMRTYVILN